MKDFYPTPKKLIKKMLNGLDLSLCEFILEPSAGKGDILDHMKQNYEFRHGRREIDVIEIEPDLRATLSGKEYRVVHDDFLTFNAKKSYDLIVANFPFSEGDKHLKKAISILEDTGGSLVCLVNSETIRNPYTNLRKSLIGRLNELGATIEHLKGEFDSAERKTSVEVALIRLHIEKPESSLVLENMRKSEDIDVTDTIDRSLTENELISTLIRRFDIECRIGINLIDEYFALKPIMMDKTGDDRYSSPIIDLKIEGGYSTKKSYVNAYLMGVRHKYWEILINDPKFRKKFTSNILGQMRQKLSELRQYDFTRFNISELEGEMRRNVTKGVEDAILKLFDEFTFKFSYHDELKNENIHYYNGWKTNRAYKINEKVIVPIDGFSSWGKKDKLEWRINEKIEDIIKIFNYFQGGVSDASGLTERAIERANSIGDFKKIDLHYFEATFFKKGTCHIKFKDKELLNKFNIYGSQKKGWLPPNYGRKRYHDMDKEEKKVIDNFQGMEEYERIMDSPQKFILDSQNLLTN